MWAMKLCDDDGKESNTTGDWDGWVQATNSCEAEGAQVVLCVVDQDGFSGEVGWEAKSGVSAAAAGGRGSEMERETEPGLVNELRNHNNVQETRTTWDAREQAMQAS